MVEQDGSDGRPIRVIVQQPALAKYRVPVFRELASRTGLDVLLTFGYERLIKNVEADGFRAVSSRTRVVKTPVGDLRWDGSQIRSATKKRCDVIVLSWNTRVLSIWPALVRARLSGIGVVIWGHGYSKREAGWRRWVRLVPARLAHSMLLYNRTVAGRIVAGGVSEDRVFVALNSLDQSAISEARERLERDPSPIAELKNQHGMHGPVVIFVSRLMRENRLDLLFDAAAEMADRFPDLRIAVVGSGPDEEFLRAHAEEIGVADRVVWAGAVYEEAEVAKWFMASDVFCYPANIGLSILHAFGYGLPVFTSDKIENQNPEIEALRDGENGVLYRDGDSGALAEALGRVLGDAEILDSMKAEALSTVADDFTIPRMVDGMEAAIRYAAGRSRGRGN